VLKRRVGRRKNFLVSIIYIEESSVAILNRISCSEYSASSSEQNDLALRILTTASHVNGRPLLCRCRILLSRAPRNGRESDTAKTQRGAQKNCVCCPGVGVRELQQSKTSLVSTAYAAEGILEC